MAINRSKAKTRGWNGLDGEAMVSWFPTATAGDGIIRPNNLRPGKEQPDAKPSPRRKVHCMQCGFLADHSRAANDGGSLDGQGAGGNITKVDGNDGTIAGDQEYRTGSGCPFCLSRNFGVSQRNVGI